MSVLTHYSLRAFLRRLSRDLLARILTLRGVDLGIEVTRLKPREIEPIFVAINRLPDSYRQLLDQDFRNIHDMGTEAGLRQIVDEGRHNDLSLLEELRRHKSFIDRAAWIFILHRAVFDCALRLSARDILAGRYWKRRLPVSLPPNIDISTAAGSLEAALRDYFMKEEGRGKSCSVEYVGRGSLHHFFAYPEDYPASPLAWNGDVLAPHAYRPAFEIVFLFDGAAGCVDIYCEGGSETITRLHGLFASAALQMSDRPEVVPPAYDLDGLRSQTFQFVRPPDSPIADIRVKRLGFRVLGRATTIGIETDVDEKRHAIHEEIERVFSVAPGLAGRIALSQTQVIGATLTATIDRGDGTRPRRRTFSISAKSCGLKYEGDDLLLRQILIESGIDLTARTPASNATRSRPAA